MSREEGKVLAPCKKWRNEPDLEPTAFARGPTRSIHGALLRHYIGQASPPDDTTQKREDSLVGPTSYHPLLFRNLSYRTWNGIRRQAGNLISNVRIKSSWDEVLKSYYITRRDCRDNKEFLTLVGVTRHVPFRGKYTKRCVHCDRIV